MAEVLREAEAIEAPHPDNVPDVDPDYVPNFMPMVEGRQLVPFADKCLVLDDEPKSQSAGGIHIADGAKELPCTGTVEAVGPDATIESAGASKGVQVGDRVLYGLFAGDPVPPGAGMKHRRFVRLPQFMAVLREPEV